MVSLFTLVCIDLKSILPSRLLARWWAFTHFVESLSNTRGPFCDILAPLSWRGTSPWLQQCSLRPRFGWPGCCLAKFRGHGGCHPKLALDKGYRRNKKHITVRYIMGWSIYNLSISFGYQNDYLNLRTMVAGSLIAPCIWNIQLETQMMSETKTGKTSGESNRGHPDSRMNDDHQLNHSGSRWVWDPPSWSSPLLGVMASCLAGAMVDDLGNHDSVDSSVIESWFILVIILKCNHFQWFFSPVIVDIGDTGVTISSVDGFARIPLFADSSGTMPISNLQQCRFVISNHFIPFLIVWQSPAYLKYTLINHH